MSELTSVCKVRMSFELTCRDCEYYGKPCDNFVKRFHRRPYEKGDNKNMAIRTGKFSLKAMMEGKTKVAKDELVGKHSHVIDIVKGTSEVNGDYVYLFLEDSKYVSVPAANVDEFMDYASDPADSEAIRKGLYDVVFEKCTSKIGREYYTCYLDIHND